VPATRTADRANIERWLKAHGVPSFVDGYASAGRVIPWAAAAAIAVVLVAIGVALVTGGVSGWGLLLTAVALLLAVGLSYLVIASGIVPLTVFALRWFVQTVVRGGASMMSVIPLLLVALAFLFLGAETWQSVGRLHGLPLVLTAGLFAGLGVLFLLRQVQPDLAEAAAFADTEALRAALPSELRVSPSALDAASAAPASELRRGERLNLQAVTAIAQVTVATVVGLAIFGFFVTFGTLVVDTDTVKAWSTETAQIWWQARIAGHHYALTSEHVRVSAFLGVFSAFYFVVSASTDRAMRRSLVEGAEQHARTCLAVRAVYRSDVVGATAGWSRPGAATP
jgi:hypothetical protein